MIPLDIDAAMRLQPGEIIRTDVESAKRGLIELGVREGSEFWDFFVNYVSTHFPSEASFEELCDVAIPSNEMMSGTEFVADVWGVPPGYVCMTSVQGEGCYLYDVSTEKAFDFNVGDSEKLISGELPCSWDSFNDFIRWFLGITPKIA